MTQKKGRRKKEKHRYKGWHNPPYDIERGIHGHCKLCHKDFKNLEAHYKRVHRGEYQRKKISINK